jgi:site-specific DNA recombinase
LKVENSEPNPLAWLVLPYKWILVDFHLSGFGAHFRARRFAYRGLLTCAYDNCKVTAEIKKEKYTYYRCTGFRGKCALPYFREEELGERLAGILKDIHIPDNILAQLQESLLNNKNREEDIRKQQGDRFAQRLAQVHRRMDQAYQDKLDAKISEEFWARKSAEWQAEETQIRGSIQALETARPERLLDAARILELANKAYFLYVKQNHTERAKLLKMVLSNCRIDAVSLYPTYREPFDLIFKKNKMEGWRARRDSNSRPSGSKPDALIQLSYGRAAKPFTISSLRQIFFDFNLELRLILGTREKSLGALSIPFETI